MDSVLILIGGVSKTQNDKGVLEERTEKREVYARTKSVTRQEFFEGGRSGLNPEMVFTVFAGDYNGESACEYMGKSYAIYRTYLPENRDYRELYVQRKGGTNGK